MNNLIRRSWSSMGSSIGSKQTMNALLNSMDSLELFQSSNVIGIRGNEGLMGGLIRGFHVSNPLQIKSSPTGKGTTKYRKHFKGTMKGIAHQGNHVSFGSYALQALDHSWITAKQIEAGRRVMTRYTRGGGKLWVRIYADKPVTQKPAEVRMGRGKGNPAFRVAVVQPCRVIYEIGGVSENVAREAIKIAASKMPIKTRFLIGDKRPDV
ncbi:hypothetical protein MKW94_030927 [Papaver nudicaule]|uniref:50S ribosomal protein L16, chloroplastic n=1 Tax=Papaver nudicaule TaxID=74823 RepID=A0AA41SB43_PAPNU|nr:hypothetical protein [Papaver nudicaule]